MHRVHRFTRSGKCDNPATGACTIVCCNCACVPLAAPLLPPCCPPAAPLLPPSVYEQDAHENKRQEQERHHAEEARLKTHLADKLAQLARDHVPVSAHHQALAAAKSSASAEFEARARELQTRLECTHAERVKEVEEQKQSE